MLSAKISRGFKNGGISTPLIRLGRLEIHIAHSNPNIDVRIFAQNYCVAIIALVYPCFELDIEQDEIRIALLIKQETE